MSYPVVRRNASVTESFEAGSFKPSKKVRRTFCKYCMQKNVVWKKIDGTPFLWDKEKNVEHVCDPDVMYRRAVEKSRPSIENTLIDAMFPDGMHCIDILINMLEEEDITVIHSEALSSQNLAVGDIPTYLLQRLFSDLQCRLSSMRGSETVLMPATSIEEIPRILASRYGADTSEGIVRPCVYSDAFIFTKIRKDRVHPSLHNKPLYSLFSALIPTTSLVVRASGHDYQPYETLVNRVFHRRDIYIPQRSLADTKVFSLYHEDDSYLYLVGSGSADLEDHVFPLGSLGTAQTPLEREVFSYQARAPSDTVVKRVFVCPIPITAVLAGWGAVRTQLGRVRQAWVWSLRDHMSFQGNVITDRDTHTEDWNSYFGDRNIVFSRRGVTVEDDFTINTTNPLATPF